MKIKFKKTFGIPGPTIKVLKDGTVRIVDHKDGELKADIDYEISETEKKSKTEITLANGSEFYFVNE